MTRLAMDDNLYLMVRRQHLAAIHLVCVAVVLIARRRLHNGNRNNALSREDMLHRRQVREEMLHELLMGGKCRQLIRMSENAFKILCQKLESDGGIRSTQRMSIEEQVARFLHIVGNDFRNRFVSFFYRRSGSATRAIDGTHVRVKVSNKDAPRYRGRKGYPTMNVLAACTFDLKFTYVLSGWEGTASDSRILKDALIREDKLYTQKVDRDRELEEEVIRETLNATQDEDHHVPRAMDNRGEQIRESIANEMWSQYLLIDGTFTPQAYTNMVDELSKSFEMAITKDHLKNRLKTVKEHFAKWHDVFKGVMLSGFSWDPITKLLGAEDDVWERLIKEKPEAAKWRNKPIHHYNEMLELFAKDRAIGTRAKTAKERNKRSKESEKRPETIEEIDEMLVTDDITLENFTSVDYINGTSSTPYSQVKIPSSSNGSTKDLCKVIEGSRPRVYSEEEIFKELVLIGNDMSEDEISDAYLFLVKHSEEARAVFGCPPYMRMNMLRKLMGARE
ncbi:hypothetical protein OSB04_007454 [Centaurea solstitialis]|uniref:Transposase n=1 Tax=Centaurea solstitialis TaxID=347529 RepID=A0AA38WSL1_9ASTR|nr:hypothetical protein OSB04_007454 [Centaurea solstitialis]